jgi:hypothetical protein
LKPAAPALLVAAAWLGGWCSAHSADGHWSAGVAPAAAGAETTAAVTVRVHGTMKSRSGAT